MGRTGKIAAGFIAIVFLLSLLSPLLIPYNPEIIDLDSLRQPPSLKHPLGTDSKGRDMLARVLSGGKISIGISLTAAFLTMAIGLTAGLISGYFGGRTDIIVMSIVDLVLSFPSLLLAIGISVVMSPGISSVMLALAAVGWASFARVIRGHVLIVREQPYIEAARAIGCTDTRMILFHLLPQCLPLALVIAGLKVGGYILTEAALSFLGLGAQPPTATWGSMISSNRVYISSAPWMVLSPGIMIAVVALCFNLLGDELRERYDVAIRSVRLHEQ